MTRFDADEPSERRKLYAAGIQAHRERGTGFVTFEVDEDSLSAAEDVDPELGTPWVQFADGTINLDCTDTELESLKDLLSEFPVFKIDEINRSKEIEGVNVRISAKADPNRIGQFVDAVFARVYGLPEDVRVWLVDL
ncbi:hypothetical protein [Natronococcus occultus]|uniref:DUF7975 domain-containing protein n=1 Tax=Natronococcus occultus SP4 TaxID=694430 RepID=L0K4Y3_9EURY|nr:hypothetical protein [Natronococcus occultus]AGB39178.1 hypothetical protein Natoc_3449 [Natronococcus occultus SP4]